LRSAVARAYVGHPQARMLLDRLAPASVESQGEDISGPQRPDEAASREVVWPPCRAGSVVVNWSAVPAEDSSLLKATRGRSVVRAGGARSLAEDHALLESLAGSSDPAILVVCKAWEPPLLDLQDFLGELGIGDSEAVDVMPVAIKSGSPVPASPRDREVWARAFVTSRHRLVSPLESNS